MLNKKWDVVLHDEFSKPYFKKLVSDIRNEYRIHTVYPKNLKKDQGYRR
jgi:uracil-DNA glycosylase